MLLCVAMHLKRNDWSLSFLCTDITIVTYKAFLWFAVCLNLCPDQLCHIHMKKWLAQVIVLLMHKTA